MELKTPDWLNVEFVQKVLRHSEKDDSIEVKNVTTEPATAKGDNYTSDMLRSNVEFSRNKSGRKVTEKLSIITKVSPTTEGQQKEMVANVGLFDTEIRMMSGALTKMNAMLSNEGHRLGARVLYTEIGDPSLLVFEDLAPLGFRMADRQTGLDLAHCLVAMRGLAKFHASSVALCEKEPELKDIYRKGMCHDEQPVEIQAFFTNGMKALAKEVDNWSELESSYSKKILALTDVCYKKAAAAAKRNNDEFQVINHGDCWVNNMLFRYNDEGKVTDHIFVDFQLCVWTSPAVDILYFLNTSASEEVLRKHQDVILKEYLETLTKTMMKIGCKTKPPTMAALEKSLEERYFYGLMSACTVLPLVLVDKSDVKSFDEIMSEGGEFNNPGYKGRLYRKAMLRRLPEWNARGLLEV